MKDYIYKIPGCNALLLATLLLGTGAPVSAQESSAEDGGEKPEQAAQAQEVKKTKTTKIKAQSAKNADSYEASEEISEDLSVSYPVDI